MLLKKNKNLKLKLYYSQHGGPFFCSARPRLRSLAQLASGPTAVRPTRAACALRTPHPRAATWAWAGKAPPRPGPAWAGNSPIALGRWFRSDGCSASSPDQNPAAAGSPSTLAHSLPFSPFLCSEWRPPVTAGTVAGWRRRRRPSRRRARSPQGERAAVERPCIGALCARAWSGDVPSSPTAWFLPVRWWWSASKNWRLGRDYPRGFYRQWRRRRELGRSRGLISC